MNAANQDLIEIRLPCRPEFVRVARLALSGVASRMDFGLEELEDLKLALSEACNNVIKHAYCQDPAGYYTIRFLVSPGELAVEVMDQGKGFEPTGAEGQPSPESILDEEGGLGLLLIRNLTDDFSIKSEPGAGTVIRMVKRKAR